MRFHNNTSNNGNNNTSISSTGLYDTYTGHYNVANGLCKDLSKEEVVTFLEKEYPIIWSKLCSCFKTVVKAQMNSTKEFKSTAKDSNGNTIVKLDADGNPISLSNKDMVDSIKKSLGYSFDEIWDDIYERMVLNIAHFILSDSSCHSYNALKFSIRNRICDIARTIKNEPFNVPIDRDEDDEAGLSDHNRNLADPSSDFDSKIATYDYLKRAVVPAHVEMFLENNKPDRLLAYLHNIAKALYFDYDLLSSIKTNGYEKAFKDVSEFLINEGYVINVPDKALKFKIPNNEVDSKIISQWLFRANKDVSEHGLHPAA